MGCSDECPFREDVARLEARAVKLETKLRTVVAAWWDVQRDGGGKLEHFERLHEVMMPLRRELTTASVCTDQTSGSREPSRAAAAAQDTNTTPAGVPEEAGDAIMIVPVLPINEEAQAMVDRLVREAQPKATTKRSLRPSDAPIEGCASCARAYHAITRWLDKRPACVKHGSLRPTPLELERQRPNEARPPCPTPRCTLREGHAEDHDDWKRAAQRPDEARSVLDRYQERAIAWLDAHGLDKPGVGLRRPLAALLASVAEPRTETTLPEHCDHCGGTAHGRVSFELGRNEGHAAGWDEAIDKCIAEVHAYRDEYHEGLATRLAALQTGSEGKP